MHCARDDARDRRALNHRVAGLDSGGDTVELNESESGIGHFGDR